MKGVYWGNPWVWHRRPLAPWMLAYAAADVCSMCALREAILGRTTVHERDDALAE